MNINRLPLAVFQTLLFLLALYRFFRTWDDLVLFAAVMLGFIAWGEWYEWQRNRRRMRERDGV